MISQGRQLGCTAPLDSEETSWQQYLSTALHAVREAAAVPAPVLVPADLLGATLTVQSSSLAVSESCNLIESHKLVHLIPQDVLHTVSQHSHCNYCHSSAQFGQNAEGKKMKKRKKQEADNVGYTDPLVTDNQTRRKAELKGAALAANEMCWMQTGWMPAVKADVTGRAVVSFAAPAAAAGWKSAVGTEHFQGRKDQYNPVGSESPH